MATQSLTRSLLFKPKTLTVFLLSRPFSAVSSSAVPRPSLSIISRLRPLSVAVPSVRLRLQSFRSFSASPSSDSLNNPNPNFSNRPPKETILLDGCDFEHWLVVVEKPQGDPTREEIIDSYIKTLAKVVGSEEEARQKIYSVSTRCYYAFGCLVPEELSFKIKEIPGVRWVLPDSYLDVKNKDYGGEPFINGEAAPYDPKYHEEWIRNNSRATERNKRSDRPRAQDNSRTFDRRVNMQNPTPNQQNQGYQNRPGPNQPVQNQGYQNRPGPNQPMQNQGYQNRPGPNQPMANQGYQNRPVQNQGYQNRPVQNQGYQNRPVQNQGYQNRPEHNQGYPNYPTQNQGYQNHPEHSQGYPNYPTQNQGYQNHPEHNQGYSNYPTQNQGYPNYPTQNQGYPNYPTQNQGYPNQDFLNSRMANQPIQNQGMQNRPPMPPNNGGAPFYNGEMPPNYMGPDAIGRMPPNASMSEMPPNAQMSEMPPNTPMSEMPPNGPMSEMPTSDVKCDQPSNDGASPPDAGLPNNSADRAAAV